MGGSAVPSNEVGVKFRWTTYEGQREQPIGIFRGGLYAF